MTTPPDARTDPARVFKDPESVEMNTDLTASAKADILRAWYHDAAESSVAEEEGMGAGEDDLVRRILLALERVTGDAGAGERTDPSKHHTLSGGPTG